MKRLFVFGTLALAFFLSSCTHKDQPTSEGGPHVTVSLRDGSNVSGTLVDNSPTKITVAGDDGISRTIPVTQVGSINYGTAPASPQPAAAEAPAPPPPPQQAANIKPVPKPVNRPVPASAPVTPPAAPPVVPPPTTAAGMRMEPDGAAESHSHPTEAAITTKTYNLGVGTTVSVRTEETIDSAKAVEGQTFAGEVTEDVLDADGAVVIPRGANAQLVIRSASKGGRFRGASDLVLDLQEASIGGREYEISTSDVVQQGKSGMGANKRTAVYTGGGAALGAIIGAIAGGGKGAAIGAGAGGGGGALAQVLTKGSSIRIPVETVLKFQLDKPLHVTAAR
jgi:hypothetical protein